MEPFVDMEYRRDGSQHGLTHVKPVDPARTDTFQGYNQGQTGDPIAQLDPMPSLMGAYIETDCGARRLLPEESRQGLGIPKEWKVEPNKISKGLLTRRTSLFHWEYLSSPVQIIPSGANGKSGPPLTFVERNEGQNPTGGPYTFLLKTP
jgi:hypothetical protein